MSNEYCHHSHARVMMVWQTSQIFETCEVYRVLGEDNGPGSAIPATNQYVGKQDFVGANGGNVEPGSTIPATIYNFYA
jgi:hypothetical protein